ncbi:MAG TPA: ABC transporter ATP-binding protein [Clostridiales bacterium]|nr:ABC transporter ATP-binding protein [Clostridiales bacterium]
MITFDKVIKKFDTVTAVNSLSFTAKKGEIVGFIGPNGSGKTTTIKMLTGILSPDSGTININGYNMAADSLNAKMSIGYIADNPDMFLRLKGIEFLSFIADIYHVNQQERIKQIERLAGVFGLTDFLNSQMMSYSHGMRQKMMVIAALIHNPAVWILDEPLTGLDPKSAYQLKRMMVEHANRGNCVFFSTHVLEVAEKLCHKVIIIQKGQSLYDGTLDNLKASHPNKELEKIFLELTCDE